jgi:hypothetical protein
VQPNTNTIRCATKDELKINPRRGSSFDSLASGTQDNEPPLHLTVCASHVQTKGAQQLNKTVEDNDSHLPSKFSTLRCSSSRGRGGRSAGARGCTCDPVTPAPSTPHLAALPPEVGQICKGTAQVHNTELL